MRTASQTRPSPRAADPFSAAEIANRLQRLREAMRRQRLNGLLVSSAAGVRYLSGFTGDSSWALVTPSRQYLITDFRFAEEAAISAPLFKTLIHRRGLPELTDRTTRRLRLRRLGFEENSLSAGAAAALKAGRRLVRTWPLLERIRAVKSPAEVAVIRAAVRAAEDGMRLAQRTYRAGMTESEAAAELRYRLVRSCEAQDQAFESIVAEGPRGSLPHARPTGRRITRDSLLLLDWGARCNFYHSDLTRVLALGRIPRLFSRLAVVVRNAQLSAMELIRPGVTLQEIDAAARKVIAKAGYGSCFGHSLGHGIGLEVHEFPRVGPRSRERAEAGMVFTVEPGIYLPGRFGIRIEDDVLVTGSGCEVLSSLPHDVRMRGD